MLSNGERTPDVAQTIYILCTLTSLACAGLLFASYRRTRYRLLFWSGSCFGVMTINNLLLVLDKVVFPNVDFLPSRLISALVALVLLLYGLIYEKE
jgi:ABC-type enterochelin transport system permease subunit